MPSYTYTARDRGGSLQKGHLDGIDEDEVITTLQNRGLTVTGLSRQEETSAGKAKLRQKSLVRRRMHGRVTVDDKVLFCQQLATLVEGGIPLLRSLQVMTAQVESKMLLEAVEQMRRDIEAGRTFRDSLARYPHIFSNFWVNLVETGEASGHLAEALNHLAKYMEQIRNIRNKAITAFTYPAVLIGAATVALGVFMLKIIPIFANMFASMEMELPPMTLAVIAMSEFLQHYFVVLILGLVGVGFLLKRFLGTDSGRWILHSCQLRVPVFSRLFMELQFAQFARGLSTLLASGVPILFSLEIMERSATNVVYGKAIGTVREFLREGKSMAEPLAQTGLFSAIMVQMIQVGEEVGELGKMLDRVALYYEGRVEAFVERMTVLFEPFAIIVMAFLIGFLVISMFMPIFQMAGGMHA